MGRAATEHGLLSALGSPVTDWRATLPAPPDPVEEDGAGDRAGVALTQSAADGSFSLPFVAGVVGVAEVVCDRCVGSNRCSQ